jgi:hypothetical protein
MIFVQATRCAAVYVVAISISVSFVICLPP